MASGSAIGPASGVAAGTGTGAGVTLAMALAVFIRGSFGNRRSRPNGPCWRRLGALIEPIVPYPFRTVKSAPDMPDTKEPQNSRVVFSATTASSARSTKFIFHPLPGRSRAARHSARVDRPWTMSGVSRLAGLHPGSLRACRYREVVQRRGSGCGDAPFGPGPLVLAPVELGEQR